MDNFQAHERYLRLLSERFPNADAVVTELINLHAILSLPKGKPSEGYRAFRERLAWCI